MSKPTSTEKFYCGLLKSVDAEIDDNKDSRLLYAYEDDGSYGPIRIDGRELVIPTLSNLKKPPEFWQDKVAFHPLTEHALRDDSKVLKTLQSLINWKTINVLGTLAYSLTQIAAHPEIPKSLSPRQHLLLDALKDANKKTVKYVKDVIDASFSGSSDKRLIKTFIKKGGRFDNQKYLAVLITTFSIFEDNNIDEEKKTIFGVKAPKIADVEAVAELFKLILPMCHVVNGEAYNYGSNDTSAPRLHALLNGYVKIARRLNEVVELFDDLIESSEELKIDLSWIEYLAEFAKIKHDIPPLEDNYGGNDSDGDNLSGKKLSTGDNNNELGNTAKEKAVDNSYGKANQKIHHTNPRRNDASSLESNDHGQQVSKENKRSNTMNIMNMMSMMNMMNDSSKGKEGNKMDPTMMAMMMGGKMDAKTMMLMNMMKGDKDMDMNTMLPLLMAGGDSDMSSMLPLLMSKGGDMDPTMLAMMMGNGKMDAKTMMLMNMMKGGDTDINSMLPLLMAGGDSDMSSMLPLLMSQGGDMDPTMLAMMMGNGKMDAKSLMMMNMMKGGDMDMNTMLPLLMSGGDSDSMMPMMMYLMGNGTKAKKGNTTTPSQPKPNKTEYPETA